VVRLELLNVWKLFINKRLQYISEYNILERGSIPILGEKGWTAPFQWAFNELWTTTVSVKPTELGQLMSYVELLCQ
jgi:hypothetical protein